MFSKNGIPFATPTGTATHGGDLVNRTNIIAASPFTKQPGTTNFRIVLRYETDRKEFMVHNEYETDGKHSFANGDYFSERNETASKPAFCEALKCFSERVARQAETSVSMFRHLKAA